MKTNDHITPVLEIIRKMADEITWGTDLNERYLHHWFSHLVQKKLGGTCFPTKTSTSTVLLHPEWPTWKKSGAQYRKYRKHDGHYRPNEKGNAGFIDFAVGERQKPTIGIEFCLSNSWRHEAVVFDFLKMLDGRLPFQAVVCWIILLRSKGAAEGKKQKRLETAMTAAAQEARERLNSDVCGESRKVWFVISEIAAGDKLHHRHLDRKQWCFMDGLPVN